MSEIPPQSYIEKEVEDECWWKVYLKLDTIHCDRTSNVESDLEKSILRVLFKIFPKPYNTKCVGAMIS